MTKKYEEGKRLFFYIKWYAGISVGLLFLFILYSAKSDGLFDMKFCFTFNCLDTVVSSMKGVIQFVEFIVKLLVSLVTIFVISHALNHYLNSIETSRSNVYLTHLNTFREYMASELEVYGRLDAKSFNVFKWYNSSFPNSRNGNLMVSDDYLLLVKEIDAEIKKSNDLNGGVSDSENDECAVFTYQEHQSRIIKVVAKIGVKIPRLPRNDFYEVEGELFSLINKLNTEFFFCPANVSLRKRKYN